MAEGEEERFLKGRDQPSSAFVGCYVSEREREVGVPKML